MVHCSGRSAGHHGFAYEKFIHNRLRMWFLHPRWEGTRKAEGATFEEWVAELGDPAVAGAMRHNHTKGHCKQQPR